MSLPGSSAALAGADPLQGGTCTPLASPAPHPFTLSPHEHPRDTRNSPVSAATFPTAGEPQPNGRECFLITQPTPLLAPHSSASDTAPVMGSTLGKWLCDVPQLSPVMTGSCCCGRAMILIHPSASRAAWETQRGLSPRWCLRLVASSLQGYTR